MGDRGEEKKDAPSVPIDDLETLFQQFVQCPFVRLAAGLMLADERPLSSRQVGCIIVNKNSFDASELL